MSKSPVQSTMQGVNHIIILKVGTDAKFDRNQVLIRYHALGCLRIKEWKEKVIGAKQIPKSDDEMKRRIPKGRIPKGRIK